MRPPVYFCASFALGCALAQYLLAPTHWITALVVSLAAAALGFALARGDLRRRVVLCALGAALAFGWSAVYRGSIVSPNEALIGRTETVELELCDYAVETAYGAKVRVRILERGLRGSAMYYGDESLLALEPGANVTDEVEFHDASDPSGAGEVIRSFTSKGIYLLLYSKGEPLYSDGNIGALRYLPKRLASTLGETIERVYDEREAGFLHALLLGDKRYLDEEDAVSLSEAGIYHITAVSGLHCAFLVDLLDRLLRPARRRTRCAVTIPLLFLYATVVGASPSVLRACVMISMTQLAPLFRRESDPPTALSFALLFILLKDPYAIASISLQLSFSAVAGLEWLTPRLTRRIRTKHRPVRVVLVSFATTLGAMVFSTPLCAWYFGTLSFVSLFSNLLCLWAVSFVFAAGLVGMLLAALLPPLAGVVSIPAAVGIRYVLFVSGILKDLPLHALYFNTTLSVLWLLYVYVLLAICALARRGRYRYPLALVLAAAMLLVTVRTNAFDAGGALFPAQNGGAESLQVASLDVGQGASTVLYSQGHAVLVDCGSSNSYIGAGDVAADYLLSAGIRRLDAVVLTHYHADHANGLPTLLARIGAEAIYLPDIAEEEGEKSEVLALAARYDIPVRYVTEETQAPLGGAALTIYPPLGEKTANELGLTILCTAGEFDALITGDMDSKTERLLIAAYVLPDIEVLLVGHHGSRYSTSEELLEAVTPEVGIVSVGDNSYGHPTDEALMRLTDEDIAVYRTDLQGTIRIRVN